MHTTPHTPGTFTPPLLHHAITGFLLSHPGDATSARLLGALDEYLGAPAPLLAYTRLTGASWLRSLPAAEQPDAATLLDAFRGYLRDGGWLNLARPVNQPD